MFILGYSWCILWIFSLFLEHMKSLFTLHSTLNIVQGLLLAFHSAFSSHARAKGVSCKAKNISADYLHCGIHPDGVHDLDCFGKYKSRGLKNCTWKPGIDTSEKKYTLIKRQQGKRCQVYYNITDFYETITLFLKVKMTVEVFENTGRTKCTKAILEASPESLLRCGPPNSASLSRHSGGLHVNVGWPEEDRKYIHNFIVRYKALGSPLWNESFVASSSRHRVENLNSSLVYIVQMRCVTSVECTQCPWSEAYTVPPPLTTPPVIVKFKYTDIPNETGCRLISISWKELYDCYSLTVGKVSGEAPFQQINTCQPEISLILSYSAYQLNISAFNNVSYSPVVSHTIPQHEVLPGVGGGNLNVTVRDNTSFTIYWKDDLIKTYVCYSVEWRKKGHPPLYMSFYQNTQNYRTLSSLPEPLEPYVRYSITLHTRPDKETCNMKHINNSESTYGTAQFYFIEGPPVRAPSNFSSHNVTGNSVVLQWSSVPEEDTRGFLLGYIIYYTEYHHRWTSTENNVTVDPDWNSYELGNLRSDTVYQVQMSGYTSAGAGVRSIPNVFKTDNDGYSNLGGFIFVFIVMATVLIFGSPIIKRVRAALWPSIPNPGHSTALQKLDRPCQLELLEAIATLTVEEWDTKSLHILEKEAVIPAATLPSMLPLLRTTEDEMDSPETTSNWIQRDTVSETGEIFPDDSPDPSLDTRRTELQSSPFVFPSDYTTMEMFQKLMPHGLPADTAVTPATGGKPDYVRQISTSPTAESGTFRIFSFDSTL
ncbi:leukemia inhibitory factor receptor [Odontesthes bonariensis]|uniref:leukemia inhibitory factor receptor n=1 Tax=Odontesthes bonariensis TaxID=219752 RepID=UPI003F58142A